MRSLCVRLVLSIAAALPLTQTWAVESASADTPREPAPEQAIGLSFGWVAANGFSYRRYIGDNYLQGTFADLTNKDTNESFIDLSLSAGRYLNRFELNRFALNRTPIGLKVVGGIETLYKKGATYGVDAGTSRKEWHFGAGVGADIGNPGARGVIFSLDVFYAATYYHFRSPRFVKLELLPSASLQYNF